MLIAALTLSAALPQANPIPQPVAPTENPITAEKATLGKILFWEEQLSSDDTVACGTCHTTAAGTADSRVGTHPGYDGILGTADDRFTSPGVVRADAAGDYRPDPLFELRRQLSARRTQDLFGALYAPEAFWDGRAADTALDPISGAVMVATGGALESQITGPPVSDVEMAHEQRDWSDIVQKLGGVQPMALATDLPADMAQALNAHPDYPALFAWAFGSPGITAERIVFAIATYERTLVPDQTPWSDFMMGNQQAMTPGQITGWNQFNSIANCHQCHTPGAFTDGDFHNLGIRPSFEDPGRQDVTGLFADRGKFKTPSLLSAGLRERFFHDGSQTELFVPGPPPMGGGPPPPLPPSVGRLYLDGGGAFRQNLDPLLVPLGGTPGLNMDAIMDFVGNALTDPRLAAGQYPFDKPTLRSERTPFGQNGYGTSTAGRPSVGQLRLLAHVPAHVGSTSFKVGVAGGPAGRTAFIGVAFQPGSGLLSQGVNLWIGPRILPLQPVLLLDDGSGSGYGTLQPDIPANPGLRGRTLFLQAFLQDPQAPTGACASTGAMIQID